MASWPLALIAVYAPRSLNEPVGWSDSGLTRRSGLSMGIGSSGVRITTEASRRAASVISARLTRPDAPSSGWSPPRSLCLWVFSAIPLPTLRNFLLSTGWITRHCSRNYYHEWHFGYRPAHKDPRNARLISRNLGRKYSFSAKLEGHLT